MHTGGHDPPQRHPVADPTHTDLTEEHRTSTLLRPFDLHGLRLPNRVVMAPTTRARATADGLVRPTHAVHYTQRASAGLPVTGAVHAGGCRVFNQLVHAGRVGHAADTGLQPVAPSAVRLDAELSTAEGPLPAPEPRAPSNLDLADVQVMAVAVADGHVDLVRRLWPGTLVADPSAGIVGRQAAREQGEHWTARGADPVSFGRTYLAGPGLAHADSSGRHSTHDSGPRGLPGGRCRGWSGQGGS